MADRPTIVTVPSGSAYSTDTLNTNFTSLRDAYDLLVARAGTGATNSTMTGDLDMAGNKIRNATFADIISGDTEVVGTISALRAVSTVAGTFALVLGYYSAGDGGGGLYRYDGADTTTADNDGSVIVDASGNRWKLLNFGTPYSVKQFGVRCDGAAGDAARLQTAFAAVDSLFVPSDGVILLDITVTLATGKSLYGPGTVTKLSTNPYGLHITGDNVVIDGVVFLSQDSTGQPNWDVKLGDGIDSPTIRNCRFNNATAGNYAAIGSSENSKFMYSVSDGNVDTSADTITVSAANAVNTGVSDGDIVKIIPINGTDVAPGGLSFNTPYYAITADRTVYQFSLTSGGAAINITSSGTGRGMIVGINTDYPYASPVTKLFVHNNRFNGYNYHMYLFFLENFSIENNSFSNCDFDSIRIREGMGTGSISNNTFKDIGNIAGSGSRDCIDTAFSGHSLVINGNTADTVAFNFVDCKGGEKLSGVENFSTRHVTISNNYAKKTYYNAVTWGAGTAYDAADSTTFIIDCKIIGNTFNECNYHNVAGAGDPAIAAIVVKRGARFVDVSHNSVTETYGRGIFVEAGCRGIRLESNSIINCTTEGIITRGPNGGIIAFNVCESVSFLKNAGVQTYGIFLENDGTLGNAKTIVSNNILRNNTTAQLGGTTTDGMTQVFVIENNYEEGTLAYDSGSGRAAWAKVKRLLFGNGAGLAKGSPSFYQGDMILNAAPVAGSRVGHVAVTDTGSSSQFVGFGQVGYRTNAGTPVGAVTPNFIGEDLLNTSASHWFKAVGLTSSDWKQITA